MKSRDHRSTRRDVLRRHASPLPISGAGRTDLSSPTWIETVATTADADVRAHRIALTYSKLATLLDDLIYDKQSVRARWHESQTPRRVNANWFHFATWGTLTVSQNISTGPAPQRLNAGLPLAFRRTLTPALAQARSADGQRLGRALSWGQRLIFVSACLAMHRFKVRQGQRRHAGRPPELEGQAIRANDRPAERVG